MILMERHIQNIFPNNEEKNMGKIPSCTHIDFTNNSSDKDPERGGISAVFPLRRGR